MIISPPPKKKTEMDQNIFTKLPFQAMIKD